MHLSTWAQTQPDAPALIMAGSGERMSFAELNDAANRGAQLMRKLGLGRGDVFALWSGNNPEFLQIAWAMQRAGVYMVPIASRLNAEETRYIVNDSGARVFIIDATLPHAPALATALKESCPKVEHAFAIRGDLAGLPRWEDAVREMPAKLIDDPAPGAPMIYSSGTTGKPKGVQHPLADTPFDAMSPLAMLHQHRYDSRPGSLWVTTAPLYHSGPLAMTMAEQNLGATILLFEKFDAEQVLAGIERHRVERGQFVPTMFLRLLKLPDETRARYDVSSLKAVVHSAAPCPVDAKHAMIEWWGPVLHEIYGGTENAGSTMIDSHEWLKKPGSVGRASFGAIHVCDEEGNELAPGQTGLIYFEGGSNFNYLNDKKKTAGSRHARHPNWSTFGDIGRIDEDGYLFLSDRKAFMIIAGGVNIYPQEAENVLAMHPDVADVVVFGVPDPVMGDLVKAVVQPADWQQAGPELEAKLIAHCRSKLATLKCPKSIDFERELPRDAAGKLSKRALRDRYWPAPKAAVGA